MNTSGLNDKKRFLFCYVLVANHMSLNGKCTRRQLLKWADLLLQKTSGAWPVWLSG